MSADVGFIPNVTGMSSAMLADVPMPGSTPTIMPEEHAEERTKRLIG